MRQLDSNPRVDNSDLANYPHGRIRDNDGSGNGTDVNERVYGDIHSTKEKLMILAGIVANNLPDNETNGYQMIESLIALASKNDYILDLTTAGGVLQIPVKVSLMKDGESLICKAAANLTVETTIKGSDNSVTAITVVGNFKANEYVRFIKSASGVILVRIADAASLDAMANELLFLKKASQAQENAGTVDTVATTPLVNKTTFARRVNGADSSAYLASHTQNGLLSKEFWDIINGLGASPVKNYGTITLDVGGSVGSIARTGDFTSAVATTGVPNTTVLVTMANAMTGPGTNYWLRVSAQGLSANLWTDNSICFPVWKPESNTQFSISFREVANSGQSIKVHIEVIQL